MHAAAVSGTCWTRAPKPLSRNCETPRFYRSLASRLRDLYAFRVKQRVHQPAPELANGEDEQRRVAPVLRIVLLLAFLLVLSMAWRWTPISEWVNLRTILVWKLSMSDHPAAFLFVIGAYVLGGLVFFPVTILNVAAVLTFGPIRGNLYSVAGWLISAGVGYGIGWALGHDLLKRLAGPRLDRVLEQAAGHGFLAVLTMRVLPVAPFSVVNLIVGAIGIRFRDFMLASLIGRIPGMILLTFAGLQLDRFLRQPSVGSLAFLALILVLIPFAAAWFTRRFKAAHRRRAADAPMRAGSSDYNA